jgi:hypothetical protein
LSGGIAANDTVAFAIDFSAGKLWVAKNNTWVGSGDPAAGTNASATFTPGTVGALYPAISQYYKNLTGGRWTIKSTSDSQTYSPPSGFSAWG